MYSSLTCALSSLKHPESKHFGHSHGLVVVIRCAGGQLPPRVRTKVPPAVAAQAQTDYKDYRSYYSYACLATGGYALFSFDSYGDGWEGGRITLTQVVNATTGCVLLSGASPMTFNLTTKFSVTVRVRDGPGVLSCIAHTCWHCCSAVSPRPQSAQQGSGQHRRSLNSGGTLTMVGLCLCVCVRPPLLLPAAAGGNAGGAAVAG